LGKRVAFWSAWLSWLVFLALATLTFLLKLQDQPSAWPSNLLSLLVLLAFATTGALIASLRPQNPVGWLFCSSTLCWILGVLLEEYAVYSLFTAPGALPAGAIAGIVGEWLSGLGWFLMITVLLLIFPDGHLPSQRWRLLVWVITGLLVADTVVQLLAPNASDADIRLAGIPNPLGIQAVAGLFNQLSGFIPLALFACAIPCIIAVIQRFRQARGVERQQLKWFAFGTSLSVLMILTIIVLVFATPTGDAPSSLFYLAVVSIPISAAIAILRYRLYDIDELINRTLVYGLLSATLLLIYLLLVFGGQHLLSSFLDPSNGVVLVASTLVVAALFQPLRVRVQQLVDRRFYRSKYDAAQVAGRFGETLRQEVNLDQLCEHLVEVVQETVQPTNLSLWLRPRKSPEEIEAEVWEAPPSR
jgi:hypothetical protein